MAMPGVHEGDRINNYILERRIGSGTFGEVWRARHHVFGSIVAIKVPTDQQYVRNLQREGVAVHGLHYPNIVRALDLDPYADPPYYIMEYVDGPSLREAIDRCRAEFPIVAAVTVMKGVLEGLAAAHHAGVIHRDIKPSNILLHCPLENLATIREADVKITDFGLGRASSLPHDSMLQSGSLAAGQKISGTIAYMSPEQREGDELDGRSDLYSCAIVLFEMLTGERPQGGELPGSLRPGIPAFLDQVFQRSYARRERRFASAKEMFAALSKGLEKRANWTPATVGQEGLRCPDCRQSVQRDDQFCIRCGRQLVASVPRCPSCRAFVKLADHYCIFCGKDLRILTA